MPTVQNNLHFPTRLRAQKTADGLRVLTSRAVKTKIPFGSLCFSVNIIFPPKSSVLLEAQVCLSGVWSAFYKIARFSPRQKISFPSQADSFARVAVDELICAKPAQAYRYRLTLAGGAKATFLHAALAREPFAYLPRMAEKMPAGEYQISVKPISQMEQNSAIARRICSPVSLCMALNSLGISTPLVEVLKGVFDRSNNLYGNWLFNTFYASQKGTRAYVRRFESLEELKKFLTKNSRVVASISFEKGELTGAQVPQTKGHLVLICGWEKNKIFVADPAAPTVKTVLRAYDAKQFARAWLKNKQGVSYIVRKK